MIRPHPAESIFTVDIHCTLPTSIETHAFPENGGIIKRTTLSATKDQPSRKLTEAFVRCGRKHRLGIFIFGPDGRLVHHWNSFSLEWRISSENQSITLIGNANRTAPIEISVPEKQCRGSAHIEAQFKFDAKEVSLSLSRGALNGDSAGEFFSVLKVRKF